MVMAPDLRDGRPPGEAEPYNTPGRQPRITPVVSAEEDVGGQDARN